MAVESGRDESGGGAGQRAAARSFRELLVWQKAHQFVLDTYRVIERFPKFETYGLSSQLRRAAVSIPANIAEGFKKRGPADKARFMNTAQGSLEEARYYLILAHDLEFADTTSPAAQLDEIGRMLDAYARAILETNS